MRSTDQRAPSPIVGGEGNNFPGLRCVPDMPGLPPVSGENARTGGGVPAFRRVEGNMLRKGNNEYMRGREGCIWR